MSITLQSPQEVALALRDRFKDRRLGRNLTQPGLARRSGVNLHSLRRFEKTGLVSFEALLKIALVLDCLDDFDQVAAGETGATEARSLDQILAHTRKRNRGRLK